MILVNNISEYKKIKKPYINIVDSAIKAYHDSIKSCRIINISLVGSVSRGEAIPTISDIDFVAITKDLVDHNEKKQLYRTASKIGHENRIVSRVDLDTIPYPTFLEDKRFQFILKTDSIKLKGRSMYKTRSFEYNESELINISSPMLSPLIESYKNGLTYPDLTSKEIIHYSHWVGKDMLTCFRSILINKTKEFPRSASSIHHSLIKIIPEEKPLFDALLKLALEPTDKREGITAALDLMQEKMSRFFV